MNGISGPHMVQFNVSAAGADFSFKPGDRVSVSKHLFDAWTASGICSPVAALDDPEELKAQIAELQQRLASAGKRQK